MADSVRIETDNGYIIEFPKGIAEDSGRPLDDLREKVPSRIGLPFVIRGKPGLISARFQFLKEGNEREDIINFDVSSVLRPGGIFTNFTSGVHEMKGEATVPKDYFPITVHSITIENLSD